MDGELVKPKPSDHKAVVAFLDNECPYYISLGMTYYDYWDGDPAMCAAYRKADELKRKRENFNLWLQGAYIYEVISDLAPSIAPFSKGKVKPYRKEVIPILPSEIEEYQERKQKEAYEAMLAGFTALAEEINESIKNKQEAVDGS